MGTSCAKPLQPNNHSHTLTTKTANSGRSFTLAEPATTAATAATAGEEKQKDTQPGLLQVQAQTVPDKMGTAATKEVTVTASQTTTTTTVSPNNSDTATATATTATTATPPSPITTATTATTATMASKKTYTGPKVPKKLKAGTMLHAFYDVLDEKMAIKPTAQAAFDRFLNTEVPRDAAMFGEIMSKGAFFSLIVHMAKLHGEVHDADAKWIGSKWTSHAKNLAKKTRAARLAALEATAAANAAKAARQRKAGKWIDGTGYGGGGRTNLSPEIVAAAQLRAASLTTLLKVAAQYLTCATGVASSKALAACSTMPPLVGNTAEVNVDLPSLKRDCTKSALLPLLQAVLCAGEADVLARPALIEAALDVVQALIMSKCLAATLTQPVHGSTCLGTTLMQLADMAADAVQPDEEAEAAAGAGAGAGADEEKTAEEASAGEVALAKVVAVAAAAKQAVPSIDVDEITLSTDDLAAVAAADGDSTATTTETEAPTEVVAGAGAGAGDATTATATATADAATADAAAPTHSPADELLYEVSMRRQRVKAAVGLLDRSTYKADVEANKSSVAKNLLKRVKFELRSMKTSLPVVFGSSVFLQYDKARPYVMQALIMAPHDTPYDSGAFLFDIYCPPGYPSCPPKVRLLTTGNGSVRFNPNLYNCGKVCLSLLGTWSGPGWEPSMSTLLQVLISIQALIFIKYPYFNEPGYESSQGTPAGDEQARVSGHCGWERLRVASIRWAMVDQIKNPPVGFEDVVAAHFWTKKQHLAAIAAQWEAHAESTNSSDHKAALPVQTKALKESLAAMAQPELVTVAKKTLADAAALTKGASEAAKAAANKTDEAEAAAAAASASAAAADTAAAAADGDATHAGAGAGAGEADARRPATIALPAGTDADAAAATVSAGKATISVTPIAA